MKRLKQLIIKLKTVEQKMFESIRKTLEENSHIIADMVSEEQLFAKGINGKGEFIADDQPYTPFTIRIKKLKGQPTNRVTLRDTGGFHKSFDVEFTASSFKVVAYDEKTEALTFKYGDEILALTDAHFKELAEDYVAPALHDILKQLWTV